MRHLIFLLVSALTLPVWAQTTVYLAPKEALKRAFQDSQTVVSEKKTLTPDQMKRIQKQTGAKVPKETWTFYLGKTGNKIDGYAVIDHQVGKTEPITYMTVISPEGTVQKVDVLVYRETHGSEVRHKRFLKQYHGKKSDNPIRVGQDIDNVSGATLSSRAMSIGVKRSLLLWETFYGKNK